MLLDELLGWACAAAGKPGMTISLRMCYRVPVPLDTPCKWMPTSQEPTTARSS
ncbi:hypothetical protein J2Z30_009781 [Streptomyces iranensis]|nr:hypothetical protein [Streptomyces iranensis]